MAKPKLFLVYSPQWVRRGLEIPKKEIRFRFKDGLQEAVNDVLNDSNYKKAIAEGNLWKFKDRTGRVLYQCVPPSSQELPTVLKMVLAKAGASVE